MAARICLGCDLYMPKTQFKIGWECAAFRKCVQTNQCGIRMPPLPRDEFGMQIVPEDPEQNIEPQAIAEVRRATS